MDEESPWPARVERFRERVECGCWARVGPLCEAVRFRAILTQTAAGPARRRWVESNLHANEQDCPADAGQSLERQGNRVKRTCGWVSSLLHPCPGIRHKMHARRQRTMGSVRGVTCRGSGRSASHSHGVIAVVL